MDDFPSLWKTIGSILGAIMAAAGAGLWFRHKNSNVNLDVTINSATEGRILALQRDSDAARRDRAEYLLRAEEAEANLRLALHDLANCEQRILSLQHELKKMKRIIVKLDPDSELYLRDDPPTRPDLSI